MSFPTLACKRVTFYSVLSGQSKPAVTQFNQVHIQAPDGTWFYTYECDPTLSTFVPQQSSLAPLTGEEFGELWPWCATILLVGFCLKMLLKVFQ
jgi:hypothetical protein